MFDPDELVPETIRPFSRREYDCMVELGMFDEERVELLRGMLVTMSPQGDPHATTTSWLHHRLCRLLDESFDVRAHSSYAASDDSEPEPDLSVSRRIHGRYYHPDSALLLIEVSDSSIRKDRKIKAEIYAAAGVPEYWIVNLSGDELVIEVHTEPRATGYRTVEYLRAGDPLRPTQLPAVVIPVSEIPWYPAT
jgi:Uma2 family endonuclease